MFEHPYGWWSLAPPLIAIGLAIATRRVFVSLFAGIFLGALITNGGHLFSAVDQMITIHLWQTLIDDQIVKIFAFTLLMGAMVGVISRGGGMRGLVALLLPWGHTRRRGQLITWLAGLLIFFDDYANTMLLGHTFRPLCDRLRISREKLSYLVDSTAAPVAGMALVSTWVAVEIQYIQDGINNIPVATERLAGKLALTAPGGELPWTAFDCFVGSIAYRFYVLWTLAWVALVALLGRDFGPMWRAERRRLAQETECDLVRPPPRDPTAPQPNTPSRWYNGLLPIVVTVATVLFLLYTTGQVALVKAHAETDLRLREIFGAADATYALLVGAWVGLAAAVLLVGVQRLLGVSQVVAAALAGARLVLPALVILYLASTLSQMTGNQPLLGVGEANSVDRSYRLYTGEFVSRCIGPWIAVWMLPTVVFMLSAVVAFATGTSFGTIGILMPIVVPLAYGVLATDNQIPAPSHPLFLAALAGVLSGAIFGDHCSPISDTTILSSQACGCHHMAHVWTQLPYAVSVGTVSIICGTLPVGLGISVWLLLPLGSIFLTATLWLLGRPVEVGLSGDTEVE